MLPQVRRIVVCLLYAALFHGAYTLHLLWVFFCKLRCVYYTYKIVFTKHGVLNT